MLDARDLATEEAAALREYVRRTRAGKMKRPTASPQPGRDGFCYSLTIEQPGSCHTISFAEGQEPPPLRSLLAALQTRAASRQTNPDDN